jgi:flagellar hook-length control protein FliK
MAVAAGTPEAVAADHGEQQARGGAPLGATAQERLVEGVRGGSRRFDFGEEAGTGGRASKSSHEGPTMARGFAEAIASSGALTAPDARGLTVATTAAGGLADATAFDDPHALGGQLVRQISMQWRDGVGDARLTLRPEHLGDVTVSLRIEQGAVTAHVTAAAPEVRAWLSAHEGLLREGLSGQGLTLHQLEVADEPADGRTDADGRRAPQDEPQPRPRRRSAKGTFEFVM